MILEYRQSSFVNRKYPDSSSLQLASYSLTDLAPASGTEPVPVAQTVSAYWT